MTADYAEYERVVTQYLKDHAHVFKLDVDPGWEPKLVKPAYDARKEIRLWWDSLRKSERPTDEHTIAKKVHEIVAKYTIPDPMTKMKPIEQDNERLERRRQRKQQWRSSLGSPVVSQVSPTPPSIGLENRTVQSFEFASSDINRQPETPTFGVTNAPMNAQRMNAPPMNAQRMNAPPMNAQRMNAPLMNAQRMNAPPMNAPPMNAQRMNAPLMNVKMNAPPMNAQRMNAPHMNAPLMNVKMNAPPMNAPPMNAQRMNAPPMNAPPMNAQRMNAPPMNAPPMNVKMNAPTMNAPPTPRIPYEQSERFKKMRYYEEQFRKQFPRRPTTAQPRSRSKWQLPPEIKPPSYNDSERNKLQRQWSADFKQHQQRVMNDPRMVRHNIMRQEMVTLNTNLEYPRLVRDRESGFQIRIPSVGFYGAVDDIVQQTKTNQQLNKLATRVRLNIRNPNTRNAFETIAIESVRCKLIIKCRNSGDAKRVVEHIMTDHVSIEHGDDGRLIITPLSHGNIASLEQLRRVTEVLKVIQMKAEARFLNFISEKYMELEFPSSIDATAVEGKNIDILLKIDGAEGKSNLSIVSTVSMNFGNPEWYNTNEGFVVRWNDAGKFIIDERFAKNRVDYRMYGYVDTFVKALETASPNHALVYKGAEWSETHRILPRFKVVVHRTQFHPTGFGLFESFIETVGGFTFGSPALTVEMSSDETFLPHSIAFDVSPNEYPSSFPQLANQIRVMWDTITSFIQHKRTQVRQIYVSPRNLRSINIHFELFVPGTSIAFDRVAIRLKTP
jgi:translation initiation factor 2 beta subunit (eIF-2beta)/eIF-5